MKKPVVIALGWLMNRILELKLSNDEHTRNTQAFQEQTSME
jgi:hypothetical protein